jgi:hypothetical protein
VRSPTDFEDSDWPPEHRPIAPEIFLHVKLLSGPFLHRADEFEEWFRSRFLIASHSVFPAIVVNNAHGELETVGLAGRRGHGVGQIEKAG